MAQRFCREPETPMEIERDLNRSNSFMLPVPQGPHYSLSKSVTKLCVLETLSIFKLYLAGERTENEANIRVFAAVILSKKRRMVQNYTKEMLTSYSVTSRILFYLQKR